MFRAIAYIFGAVAFGICAFLTIGITAIVLRAVFRKPKKWEEATLEDEIGYDDNDPGVDVDEPPEFETSCVRDGRHPDLGPCLACDECRYWAPGSCER